MALPPAPTDPKALLSGLAVTPPESMDAATLQQYAAAQHTAVVKLSAAAQHTNKKMELSARLCGASMVGQRMASETMMTTMTKFTPLLYAQD